MSHRAIRKRPAGRGKRTTLKDIAERVGVSINTVSAVLNPRSIEIKVSPTTREKVEQVARELRYTRNVAASRLAGGAAHSLGVLTDRLTNLFFAPILNAFEIEVVSRGYQCLLGCTHYEGPRKLEHLRRFSEYGVDGLLFTTIWHDPDVEEEMQRTLSTDTPMVFLDIPWEKYAAPLVSGDHFSGGRLLGEHLIELGHRDFAFLVYARNRQYPSVRNRLLGVQAALEQAGLEEDRVSVLSARDSSPEGLAAVVIEHLKTRPETSVVLAEHDQLASCLIAGLHAAQYRVPHDVAVTGYDDLYDLFLGYMGLPRGAELPWSIPLTTVRQPYAEMGCKAAEVLINLIESGRPPAREEHVLDVELMVRESSQLPARLRGRAGTPA